jgi:hypothetical protein
MNFSYLQGLRKLSIMGCINGKSILTEEDIEFIARNTAMDQNAVEVSCLLIELVKCGHKRNWGPSICLP